MRTPDNHNNTRLCRLAGEPEAFQRMGLDTKSVATGGCDVRIADTFDVAHLRFTGIVHLERFVERSEVEDASDHGIWELMYFGHHLAR
jgi:hypothetical protein